MIKELAKELFLTVVCGGILFAVKKMWNYLNSDHPYSDKFDYRKTRKQFYFFLICAFVSYFARLFPLSEILRILSGIVFFFSLIFMWGAFDALCNVFENIENDKSEKNPDKPY